MLRLCTLGGLDLSAGGDQVHPLLSQPKRLGLLVYLAAANSHGYRRRDSILPLFWPELDQDRARNALRQATYVLRRDLGDGVVRLHGEEELGVDPAALWVDVAAFEAALAAGEYRAAADLYRGDFLEGFFVSGAGAEFDEWVAGERSRLRGLASRTMRAQAEAAVASEPSAAAVWIRRALAFAPDDELAVRQALEQLTRIGDRAGALHLYHEFRERLDREYTAEPATETKAMGEALRLSHDPELSAEHHVARSTEIPPADTRGAIASAAPPPPAVRRHRAVLARVIGSHRRRVVAGALAVVLLASGWSLWRVRAGGDSPGSLGSFKTTDRILVGDIAAQPADSLNAWALTVWLRRSLADSRAINVVSSESMREALGRMRLPETTPVDAAVARELALRNGYVATVTSELTPVGSSYVLSAHLTSVRGVELAMASETAPGVDSLVAALGRLSKALRSSLGESRDSLVAIRPLLQVTTGSMRALQLYTQAQDVSQWSLGRGQQPADMMALLRDALAIDSTFAMAHRRLAAALYNLGFTRESMAEFRAAERFSDKLADVERLTVLVSLHLNLQEHARSIAEAIEIHRLSPDSPFAGTWLAFNYFDTGQYDLAEKQIPAMRSARSLGDGGFWSNLREYQGRGAEALDSARAFYRRYEHSTDSVSLRSARRQLATFHAVRFAYDSAVVYASSRDQADKGVPIILAASQFARGQLTKAIATQRVRASRGDELPLSGFFTTAESFTALATMLMNSDRASASRRLDAVLADTSYRNRDPANRHIRPVLALALVGRATDARRELSAIERALNEDIRKNREPSLELARGAVALAERRPREAIEAFRRVGTVFNSHDTCRICALPWLGRAYEAGNQPDSATVVYERYLSTGDPFRVMSDAAWRAVILRRLGELHAKRGDTVQAVKRLSEFVELWQDADSELQPQVETARRRLVELRSVLADRAGRAPATLAAAKR